AIDAAPEDADREAAGLECAAMCLAVDAACETADDDETGARQLATEATRDLRAVMRARARAHDRDGGPLGDVALAGSAGVQLLRRVEDRAEERWKTRPPEHATLGHRSSSRGERYESASATCSGSTASAPASAATVRATRVTRARPRAERGSRSTARDSSSSAATGPRAGAPATDP